MAPLKGELAAKRSEGLYPSTPEKFSPTKFDGKHGGKA